LVYVVPIFRRVISRTQKSVIEAIVELLNCRADLAISARCEWGSGVCDADRWTTEKETCASFQPAMNSH